MRLALFGASPDTPNMGVSALYMSAITSLSQHLDGVEFVVFDHQLGERSTSLSLSEGRQIKITFYGARGGRRYYRPENLLSMTIASKLGHFGGLLNKGVHLIDICDAVLDISGGDSFSDIYGYSRFDSVCRPKEIALNRGKPLILLPQTYGPYKDKAVRQLAASVVRRSSMAWARDAHSYQALKDLLGRDFAPERYFCGVDMAFSLRPSNAEHMLDGLLKSWIEKRQEAQPLVGFNISGLIYNDPVAASTNYDIKADYRQVVTGFIGRLLKETSARIVLVSHVMDQPGHYESDLAACLDVAEQLDESYSNRVTIAPATLDQSQVKWLVSRMDWFCGTRMHSTIAGLSSGVPTASVSYSDKTKGVFETCGQGKHVADPRYLSTSEVINQLLVSYYSMQEARESLGTHLPNVLRAADEQIRQISKLIISLNQ